MKWRAAVLAAALWIGLASVAAAQLRAHRSLSVEDGLVHSTVLSIGEDRSGFLWFGTADGVSRFDGLEFINFQSQDGLPEGPVDAIFQGSDGVLYFGTPGGVGIYQYGNFIRPPSGSGLVNAAVNSISGSPGGSIFFSIGKGVVALRPGGRYERLLLEEEALDIGILSLLAARDGALYIGTRGGLLIYRGGRLEPALRMKDGLPGDYVFALSEGRDGTILVGTGRGLALYRGGILLKTGKSVGPGETVLAVKEASDNTLLLGTYRAGLLRGRLSGTFDSVITDDGVIQVNAVHQTRGGMVYFGTEHGIGVYDPGRSVENWTRATGFTGGSVGAITEDSQGNVHAGTSEGLARLVEDRWERLAPPAGSRPETILALHFDASGRLYSGNGRGELKVYEGGKLVRTFSEREGLRGGVNAIRGGPNGDLYIGADSGLFFLQQEKLTKLLDDPVQAIVGATDGGLYLGTPQGLVLYQKGRVSRIWTRQNGLAADKVLSLRTARDGGSLYVGTTRGLSILRDGRLRTVDRRVGLTNDWIYCILEDSAGRVYLSTKRGINVIGRTPSPVAVHPPLTHADGLAGDQGTLGSCHRDRDGRLWFGSVAGVSVFDPAAPRPVREPPRVHLSAIHLAGEEVQPPSGDRVLRFEEGQSPLTLSFLAVDLTTPHRVLYRYRLAGADPQWSETTDRTVHYARLAPGDYTFEVQAANEPARWSDPARLRFTVPVPFYLRWPFLLLTTLAIGSAIAAMVVYRARHLLAIERLRTTIAADLHDQIGSGLTEIAILSEIAAQANSDPVTPSAELSRIAGIARDLTARMNDVVWLINPRRDSLHQLFLRLKDSYAELFAQNGVLFRTVDLSLFERVRLPISYRQNLYLIFKEALHNALRHGGCTEIELDVALRGRRLEVTLRDDGRGFDPTAPREQGDGLANMRRRAGAIGGELTLEASPGRGTVVRFVGPLG